LGSGLPLLACHGQGKWPQGRKPYRPNFFRWQANKKNMDLNGREPLGVLPIHEQALAQLGRSLQFATEPVEDGWAPSSATEL
jgi:hypothetical protein